MPAINALPRAVRISSSSAAPPSVSGRCPTTSSAVRRCPTASAGADCAKAACPARHQYSMALSMKPGFGAVVGEDLGPRGGEVGEPLLQDLRHPRVQLLPPAFQQARVGGLLHQRVLEDVRRVGRQAAPEEQLRSDQLLQRRAQTIFRQRTPRPRAAGSRTPGRSPRQPGPPPSRAPADRGGRGASRAGWTGSPSWATGRRARSVRPPPS